MESNAGPQQWYGGYPCHTYTVPHLYLYLSQTRARTMVVRNGHRTYAKTGSTTP